MRLYLLVAVIAALCTFMLTAVLRRLAVEWKILTPVRSRDVHATPIPRLGGIAMCLGFLIAIAISSAIPYFEPVFAETKVNAVMIGVGGIALLGAFDDIWDLDWYAKLAGQILIALAMAYNGVQLISLPIFGLTIGSSNISLAATVFIIVAIMNAVNFVDGLDGLAAGVVGIGGLAFFSYSYLLTRVSGALTYATTASLITAALVGICIGFLPFNFHPGSIFMGDSGALTLGTIMASAGIIVTGEIDPTVLGETQMFTSLVPIILPLLVLVLPLLDMTMAVVRRYLAGKSPFSPDRMHIHHRLLNLGHSHMRVVLLLYLWTVVITFPTVASLVYPLEIVAAVAIAGVSLATFLTGKYLPRAKQKLLRKKAGK